MSETYIYHHGIKGMKWGVRRTPEQLGHRRKRSLNDAVASIKRKTAVVAQNSSGTKSLKDMSDDELRKALNRLDMEKRYNQYLSEANQKKQSRAKKIVGDILESGIKTMANKAFEKAARSIFEANKPEEKDPATKIDFDDVSKVGDKALKNALQRINTEQAYRKAMVEIQVDRAQEARLKKWLEDAQKKKENK